MKDREPSQKESKLLTDNFFDNPCPTYSRLRVSDPVHWSDETNCWLVTQYKDIHAGLKDPRLIVKRETKQIAELSLPEKQQVAALKDFYSKWLLYIDPPDHTRLRKSVNKVFTPAAIETRKQNIINETHNLFNNLEGESRIDLLHDFSAPLAINVISNTLGLKTENYAQVKDWSDEIVGFIVGRTKGLEGALNAQKSLNSFKEHLTTVFDEKKEYPDTSVLHSLVSAQQAGAISRDEAFAIYGNILLDGHEPIANGITNGVLSLLQNQKQMALLREEPKLITSATEELLRYQSPFQFSSRIAKEDIELHGKMIRKGQKACLVLGSANRDPEVFSNPDMLDITRQDNKQLAFAHGTHFCLGAALARPTLQIAYQNLLDRFPSMQLTGEPLKWQHAFAIRELKRLPINL